MKTNLSFDHLSDCLRHGITFIIVQSILLYSVSTLCQAQVDAKRPDTPRQRDLNYTIRIRAAAFEPLRDSGKAAMASIKRNTPESAYRIIQLTGPLTRKQEGILKNTFHLRLDRYIPNFAYLEKVNAEILRDLRKLDFYRWDGPYVPEFKLDPDIGKHTFTTQKRKSLPGILLTVVAFPDANIEELAARVRRLNFNVLSVTNEPKYRIKRLQARISFASQAKLIAELPDVESIEELSEVTLNNGTTSWVIQSNVNNSRTIWNRGLLGQGQIIGHIDGLIDINHCFFRDNVDNTIRADHRKVVGLRNASGNAGDSHGTFSAGNAMGEDFNNDALSAAPNANNGNAPRARVSHGNLNDLDLNAGGGTSFISYLSQAAEDGAFIHTNSWDPKNTSNYTQVSADADRFSWENEDHILVFGPDNNGTIRPGTNAKNVFVVNATQQAPNQNNFSSGVTQFTQDGRRKPDVMGPGANITSAAVGTACGTRVSSGTSFAAPSVAGGVALVRQYFTEGWYPSGTRQVQHGFIPTGNLLKALVANATVDATGINGYPGMAGTGEGWGRVLLDNGLYFAGEARNLSVWDTRKDNGLFTGESHTYQVTVQNAGEQLKITLAWSEPASPANTATGPADAAGSLTINDLDLRVTSPDGTLVFSGNDIATATGLSNPNGGVADGVNLLEQVILNNPPLGTYTITVREGANGIDQGPQGYALVATGNFPDPPVPTGNQNTLVVRTGINDLNAGALPSLTAVQNVMNDVITNISEVSYGVTTITPSYTTAVVPQPSTFYYHPSRSVLIELTEDVVANLLSVNEDVFDQGTPDETDDIERMIIVINDPSFTGDWATTGLWPYTLPNGLTRRISVSIQSAFNDPLPRFTHGLAHQLGLADLYNHPNVVFTLPHVDNWDHMAVAHLNTGYLSWSKELATWISSHGSSIQYIPRPAVGSPVNQTIGINFVSSAATNRKAIAIGLTEGAAALANENVFYYIESRSNATGSVDASLPQSGVLLYYVNENIPPGQGPVRIIDHTPGTLTLDDAAIPIGATVTTPEGLTITVQAGTAGADHNIQLSYDPPATDNDVSIRKGDPGWTSPDIWVDSPRQGFDADNSRTPEDRGDKPVLNVVNRLYYRIRNAGPDAGRNFMIYGKVSEPYHTVGGAADFNVSVGQRLVADLGDDAELVDYFEWTPTADGNPHSCATITIPNVFNDINDLNNTAQQNLQVVPSVTSSPYEAVNYHFGFTNPEDHQELFYFLAENVPAGWTYTVTPRSARLTAGQRIEAVLTLQPPLDATVCTNHKINVSSWSPRGNTIIPIGGGTVQVNLRNRTDLSIQTTVTDCNRQVITKAVVVNNRPQDSTWFPAASNAQSNGRNCRVIQTQGCTNPVRANEEITLQYTTPDGYPLYRTVTTDAYGCFSDAYVVAEGGLWTVTAEFEGDNCAGPAISWVPTSIDLPQTHDQDNDRVPDADEPQGDHDRDGIPGIFDTDSDNDNLPDGQEVPGDPDRDGHDNLVDDDSDGDKIKDGRDPTPYGKDDPRGLKRWAFIPSLGSSHPIGAFNATSDANIFVGLDLEYALTRRWSALALIGLSQFTREQSALTDHERIVNLSINARYFFLITPRLKYYLQGGAGSYRLKGATTASGINAGIGAYIPIRWNRNLVFGVDYHRAQFKNETQFVAIRLGLTLP